MKNFLSLLLCLGLTPALPAQIAVKKIVGLQVDADTNNKANPGDTLRYTITITNTSSTNLLNVVLNDTNYPNQTLVAGSIKSTPVARPDSYAAVIGNTLYNVAAPGVLANDSDPDGDAVTVMGFSAASAHGGTVTVANNGGFTFLPPVGYQGPDTFTYTISDGFGGSNTATVTLTIGNMVWYVNNAGANGDGRQTSPFNSLTPVNGASANGDYIYVFQGSGNYTAGIALKNSQQLIGAGDALVVGDTTIYAAGTRPTILAGSGSSVGLASDNIVHGLNIGSANGRAFTGASVGNLVISNAIASAVGDRAISLSTGTVNVTLDSVSSTNSADNGINLTGLSGTFVANGGTVVSPAAAAFLVSGGTVNVTCSAAMSQANNAALVAVANHATGTLTFQTGALTASNGTGLQFNNADGVYNFNGAVTLNGGDAGIDIENGSSGNFTFLNAPITNPTGAAFRVNGGGGSIGHVGAITKSSAGQVVDIQSRNGGSVTLNSSITANTSASGILVQNCTGGTVTFAGTSKSLSTGANTAVNLVSNSGTTINFSNGGLVITTSGTGFSATGGATAISVTGTGNTINSGTGTALNVANTTIGASGLTFQSISSSGGSATGIILDNTGSSGGLTVTGTGSAGTGGTLVSKTGADGSTSTGIGIYLNNTRNHAFNWMQINDCQNFGIRGLNVTSFGITNTIVNGANGTSTPAREGSVIFDNIFGTCGLVNSTVRGGVEDNFRAENDNGTLASLLVSGCTIGNNSIVSGNIGVRIASKLTGVMTATVRNCTFQGNRTDSISCDAGDSGTLTISILTNTIIADTGGNNQGNIGIDVTTALNGRVNYNIDGNKVGTDGVMAQPLLNTGINVFNGTLVTSGTPAFMSGTVRGNTVVNAGAGVSGFGIRVFNQGYGTIAANIAGNNVSNVGLDYGLLVEASSNSGTANAPCTNIVGVTGNTVNVLSGALDAIRLQARGRGVISARINSNVSSGGGTGFRGLEIRQANQTIPAGGTVYTATFNLEGLTTGLQNNYNTIVNYLQSQNPSITLANCDALYVTGITGVPLVSGIP